MEPGRTVQVYSGELAQLPDLNWGWFAEVYADGPCWFGDPNHNFYAIPRISGFNQCYDDNNGCNAGYPFNVGRFDPLMKSFTVILLGPGAAGQGFQGFAWGIPTYLPQAVAFNSGHRSTATASGNATWTLNAQGFWNFSGNANEGGVLGEEYAFGMALNVNDANGNPIAVNHQGSLGPNIPFGNNNDSWTDEGFDQQIADRWPEIVAARSRADMQASTDPLHVFEGVLEALGLAAAAPLLVVGLVIAGHGYTCDPVQVSASGDNGGMAVDVSWTCRK